MSYRLEDDLPSSQLSFHGWRDELRLAAECMQQDIPRPMNGHPFEMKIEPGVYQLDDVLQPDRLPKPRRIRNNHDEIYLMRDRRASQLRKEIATFWSLGPRMESLGYLHKRGLLLYGPPGSGKSTLIQNEINEAVNDERIVLYSKNPFIMSRSLENLREMEPDREVIAIIEDIDQIITSFGGYELLEMMSGAHTVDRVLFIGTTNFPKKLPANLMRPGRFDRKVHVPAPGYRMRLEYLHRKVGPTLNEVRIDTIAKRTKGMGFGHLKEMVTMMEGYGASLNEALKSVRGELIES